MGSQFPSGGGGSLVFLGEVIAANAASIDITDVMSSLYDSYKFELIDLKSHTSAVNLYMRVSTNNGGLWKNAATDYKYGGVQITPGGTILCDQNSSGAAQIQGQITNGHFHTDAARALNGFIEAVGVNGAGSYPVFFISASHSVTAGSPSGGWCWAQYARALETVNAIQLLASSGNISGTVRAFGMKAE